MLLCVWLSLLCCLAASGPALSAVAPLSAANPVAEGFAPILRPGESKPPADHVCFSDKRKAIATNAWWRPALQPPPPGGKALLQSLPYVYGLLPNGLEVYYPYLKTAPNAAANLLPEQPSWVITMEETPSYCVQDADELTATVAWTEMMEATIVRGSPYVTVRFEGAMFKLVAPLTIQKYTIDGVPYLCGPPNNGGRTFTVSFKGGLAGDEEWTIFAPSQTAFKCDPVQGLSTRDPFFGLIRLALTNNCTTGRVWTKTPQSHCGPLGEKQPGDYPRAVVESSAVCTRGSKVSVEATPRGIQTTIAFSNFPCWGSATAKVQEAQGRMLLSVPPHLLALLAAAGNSTTVVAGGGHRDVTGWHPGVLTGNTWVFTLPYQPLDWLRPPDKRKRGAILRALKGMGKLSDVHFDPKAGPNASDPYTAGRRLFKLATLVQIADGLGEVKVAAELLARLTDHLSAWLGPGGDGHNRLVYDAAWGGIVSCGGAPAETKPAGNLTGAQCPAVTAGIVDSGNGFFVDHHLHYGHFVYAAAVVAKFNQDWATQNNQKVLALIRDVANPSPQDPYFAPYRHFDWYAGHAFGSGLLPDPLGRRQGPPSESLAAWYSIYLYGLATRNEQLKTVGNALYLMEAHSTNFYSYLVNASGFFGKNYTQAVVGVTHDTKVEFQAAPGMKDFAVYGRQLLPLTPVLPLVLRPSWLAQAWPRFNRSCAAEEECRASGFVGLLYAEQALADRDAAWQEALALPRRFLAEEGPVSATTSRTALLHFIAVYGNDLEGVILSPAEDGNGNWLFTTFFALLMLLVFAGAGFSVFSRLFPEQRARLFRRWEAVADGDGGQAEGLVATEGEPAPAYGTAP
eukprot:EG_transcript_1903